MPLLIPPAVNYPSPLVAVPSLMQDEPKEGRKQVSCEINWGAPAAILAAKAVAINLQNNATLNFSQVSSLKVDNSKCGADVTFLFPDTFETITIPAGAPLAVVPVFSNSTQFYVSAPNSLAGDITRFQVLNYRTYPADVPDAQNQQATKVATLDLGTPGPITIIGAAISGTLNSVVMGFSYQPNAGSTGVPFQYQFNLADNRAGTSTFVIPSSVSGLDNAPINGVQLLNLTGLTRRFTNGLDFNFSGGIPVPVGLKSLTLFVAYSLP